MNDTAPWVRPHKQSRLALLFPIDPKDWAKADLHGLDSLISEPQFDWRRP
jgi:hypothetical protein